LGYSPYEQAIGILDQTSDVLPSQLIRSEVTFLSNDCEIIFQENRGILVSNRRDVSGYTNWQPYRGGTQTRLLAARAHSRASAPFA